MATENLIKHWRLERALSQEKVARLSNISVSSLRKYENGERRPKIETLMRIAEVLDVDASDLIKNDMISDEELKKMRQAVGLPPEEVNPDNLIAYFNELNAQAQILGYQYIKDLGKIPGYLKYAPEEAEEIARINNRDFYLLLNKKQID